MFIKRVSVEFLQFFVFANLTHYAFLKIFQYFSHYYTREGGCAYGGLSRDYLQEIYSCRYATGGEGRKGREATEEGMQGEVPNILGVSPLDFGGARRSQRIAAIVHRGKHRATSGGPQLRYKILPRVTRCSPPEETRAFSRPAARYSIRRGRGDDSEDNGKLLRRQGCVKPRGTRPKEISSLSSCVPFSERVVCAAI